MKETKDKELNKQLQEFLNTAAGGCKFVSIGRKGVGGAVFGTAEEAAEAIKLLNGSPFNDALLELDVWTKTG